jgi:hypothetical protein
MASPDHMAGINALPKWDPSNVAAGYRYDWRNYDPADYAAFKAAQNAHDKKAMADAKARSKQVMKEVNKTIADKLKDAKQSNRQKAASRDQVKAWAKAGHTLYADIPSTCFEELKFIPDKDDPSVGTIVGTFFHGGSLTYSGDADLEEFLDAVASGSLGEAYADAKWF